MSGPGDASPAPDARGAGDARGTAAPGLAGQPLLALDGVSRHFGGLHVLQDVSLAVRPGRIAGLIGPNGAGKTTLFNLVTGLLAPDAGRIAFAGADLAGARPHEITRRGIARTFQNIRIFKDMTLLENVVVGMHRRLDYGTGALLLGLPGFRAAERRARERARELLSWMKLERQADDLADKLSYGAQRRLEIARALATEPQLLLLDEPVAGMNGTEKSALMREILAIRARGYTIFMIEHDMRFVMGLCEEISVLNFGRIIAHGDPERVRNDAQVIEAYLGREEQDGEDSDSGDATRAPAAPRGRAG